MTVIKNNIYLYEEHAEIEIVHTDYRVNVEIDIEDIDKISKLRLTGNGYPVFTKDNVLLSRFLMNCRYGDGLHVDHIDGNTLNNKKNNLRIVTKSINERNKHKFSRNNTGIIGIQYRENGTYKYYRVSWRNLDGKRFTKQFNINKLGDEQAFEQAKHLLSEKHQQYAYLSNDNSNI